MAPPFIISFGGGKGPDLENVVPEAEGVGKTTLADYFVNTFGWKKLSFAGPIKKYCIDSGLLTEKDILHENKDKPNEKGIIPRIVMQNVGMEGRKEGKWIKIAAEELSSENALPVVIDDNRFPDEQEMLLGFNNTLFIQIVRDIEVKGDKHPSCTQILKYDVKIMNKGTLADLCEQVEKKIVEHFNLEKLPSYN